MKKPILYGVLGLTATVVAAAAAAPMVIGNGVRDATMNGLLDLLPPESRSQLQITETRFDSGWFSSEGELDVRYASLAEQENLAVRLLFNISHGPLLFTPDGIRLGLAYAEIVPSFNSPELTQALTELSIEFPELTIDLLADLDQSLHIGLDMPAFNYGDAAGQLTFAGMNGSVLAKPDLSAELKFNMGELRAEQAATQMGFTIAGLNIESSSEKMNELMAPSMAMLAIPAISSAAPYPFSISNINVNSRVATSLAGPQQVDMRQSLTIANIESDIPLASLNWTTNFNEVHSDLFRSYYAMITDIQNAINNDPTAALNSGEQYAEEIAAIAIRNSLVFNSLVEANAFEGDHSIDIRVDWRGLPDYTDLDSVEAMEILGVFSFSLNLSLDEAAIMRSPLADMVDPYVQQGYLRRDNGLILMDMDLSDAELTVNGETVGLEQFL